MPHTRLQSPAEAAALARLAILRISLKECLSKYRVDRLVEKYGIDGKLFE